MPNRIKIIVVSTTVWNNDNSFGNSFSNIFGGNSQYEIFNIYCGTGLPKTTVCSRFFQITERGIIKNLISGKNKSGQEVFINNPLNAICHGNRETLFINKIKTIRWQIFFWLRDLIWGTGRWKSKELDNFITDIAPDIVFLPLYYSSYMNDIGLYIQKVANVKMVGFVSDDIYTLKQFSMSPLFWIDRLIKRGFIKKAIDRCEILYTITTKQQEEYNKIFGNKCKVLYKGGDFNNYSHKKLILNNPVKLVYTGNLGAGRWKTLEWIAQSLDKINHDYIKAQLFIYSQTYLSDSAKQKLQIEGSSFFLGGISSFEVKSIQRDADILIHVESFDISERYSARLSFSTKIVDYFEAGRCILAVGWKNTAAIEYLKQNDAAVVITDMDQLDSVLNNIISDSQIIITYANKAFECGRQYHKLEDIRCVLYEDLKIVAAKTIGL